MSGHSTFYIVKRANAYGFPPDAFSRGAQQPEDARDQEADSAADGGEADAQRLAPIAGDDTGRTETWGGDTTGESDGSLRSEVDATIETLETPRGELE